MDYLDTRLEEIGVPYVLCTVAVKYDSTKKESVHQVSIDDKKESYRAVRLSLQKRS